MKVLKPKQLGYLERTYGIGSQHYYVLSASLYFDLQTAKPLVENKQMPLVAKVLGEQILDPALPKQSAEYLVAGHAYAPQENCRQMQVSVEVGELTKTLSIYGARHWQRNLLGFATPSKPEVFDKVKLDHQHAYGGDKTPYNPLGTGYDYSSALPQVEHKGGKPLKPGMKQEPTGLMPLAITWPQRARYQGKHTKNWIQDYFPAMPGDTDPKLFQMAAEDQQFAGYLQGDESFNLQGMHPDQTKIQGHLPGVRVRAFIGKQAALGEEVEMHADTLWLLPEQRLGVMFFRGQVVVKEPENLPFSTVMLAYENMHDLPKTLGHYQQVFRLRTQPETAVAHANNDFPLMPELSSEQKKQRAQQLSQQLAEKRQALIKQQPGVKPELSAFDHILQQDLEQGNMDLTGVIAENKQKVAILQEQASKTPQEQQQKAPWKCIDETQARTNFAGPTPPIPSALADQYAPADWALMHKQQRTAEQMSIQADDCVQISPQAKKALSQLMAERIQAGQDLVGVDLTGATLCDLHLEGLDFSHSILSFSDLRGATFSHCNFSQSALCNAQLAHTQFESCVFEDTNFSGVIGQACRFSQSEFRNINWRFSQLNECCWQDCLLQQGMLNNCQLQHNLLINCRLLTLTWANCSLNDIEFFDCELQQNTFSESELHLSRWQQSRINRCVFQQCQLPLANFNQVQADRLVFSVDTELLRANFSQAKCETTSFRSVKAKGLLAHQANFSRCDFSESDLRFSQFEHCRLYLCISTHTDLSYGQLIDCNCYDSRFRGAKFHHALLRKVNLLQADLMWASFAYAKLEYCKNITDITQRDLNKQGKKHDPKRVSQLA